MRLLGIPYTKLHTKLEISSSSSFRDIALRIGVTSLTFQVHVTWSRDHSVAHMPFPIGGPLEPSVY